MRRKEFLLIMVLLILLSGCSDTEQVMDGDGMQNSCRRISQEEVVTEDPVTESANTEDAEELRENAVRLTASLVMEVNGKIYYPDLMDNSSAEAFFKL